MESINGTVFFPEAFAVAAGDLPEEEAALLRRTFGEVVLLPPDRQIAAPVSRHPDMIFSTVGDALVLHETTYRAMRRSVDRILTLGGFRLVLTSQAREPVYPADVGLNALILPEPRLMLGRADALAPELLALAERQGLRLRSVRQGYAACSAFVAGGMVATADGGIARAVEEEGGTVLRIPAENGILLPGYGGGFLGGCGGVAQGTAFFFGDPARHPALDPFCKALLLRNIRIVPLSRKPLTDRGGLRVFPIR